MSKKESAIRRYFDSIDSPLSSVVYLCLNTDCFYCETYMSATECGWKDAWNSQHETLQPYPVCASCDEVMWREQVEHNELEALVNGTSTT